jgi:hypothetical protein
MLSVDQLYSFDNKLIQRQVVTGGLSSQMTPIKPISPHSFNFSLKKT